MSSVTDCIILHIILSYFWYKMWFNRMQSEQKFATMLQIFGVVTNLMKKKLISMVFVQHSNKIERCVLCVSAHIVNADDILETM